ncbi:MAG: MarR family transcriptional regulator [Shewanella psychromarinicola]|jgi:DNA-binding MarR family transcriptional regulator|uniref:MarR family transcriptional regulator n=1 Tax=Shewanella psychromarinicola TaxID=2487742 RepID=A0A3N4EBE8_9GAMM|nr:MULTISPECIES: MarR family transcriptional regulator [Shewanella]AZG36344.1 MarR family transcriptional regulator [Shewanella psychromarinicola]MCL1080781.1 MarR family transcriptional regulator [Shewanella psychromarinicola]PKG77633.1 MarR family transcriptional regulator [Shewanella sp. Actino-trap-3]RPA34186.1 MarR family transcriptional regulator [Shewanella psychromarinicola]|tara:strand:- start:2466 stop:2951 length:486 start_codon:yes stop_codon:yes gene_type:complete
MEKYEQLLISLRRVIRAIDIHSRQLNKLSGLTGPQLMVIQKVDQLEAPLAKKIAQEINLSAATVTTIIDRLEKRGFVIRTRSETDKRKVHLSLSEAGKTLLNSAPKPLQEHFIMRYQNLEEWEQSQLLSAVERIATMMDANDIDAAPVLYVGQIQVEDQPQ